MQGLPRRGLLWCFCRSAWAARHIVDKPDDPAACPSWGNVAVIFTVIFLVALGAKWLRARIPAEGAKRAKEGCLSSEEALECRLRRSFSQMEQELVKQVTLVRDLKADLSSRHSGCTVPECQRGRRSRSSAGSSSIGAFNLVVYDVAEEE